MAINLVPIYAKSAPIACADKIDAPCEILPDRATGPSKNSLTSLTNAKGLNAPAWPPAPAQTRIKPSAPSSTAFFACLILMTSCITAPP